MFTQNTGGSRSVDMQIPLTSYPGRGIGLPINLNYSSAGLWRIGFIRSVPMGSSVWRSVTEAIYAEHSTAGWTTSLDVPKVEWPKQNDVYWYTGKPYPRGTVANFTFRVAQVFIHMPDGSTHELRKQDAVYQDGGFVNTTGTFYAVDGSRMRYDSTGPETGTLYLPDGTRYVLNTNTTQCIDRNGNTLTFNADTRQWTDTMGRVIGMPWPTNPAPGDYLYSLPGVNGSTLRYTLRFKPLSSALTQDASGQFPALKAMADFYLPDPNSPPTGNGTSNFPQPTQGAAHFVSAFTDPEETSQSFVHVVGRGQSGSSVFNPTVLAEVELPNGQKYKFTYNAHGELDKVVYPTGGYQRYQYGRVPTIGGSSVPYSQGTRGITSRFVSANGTGSDEAQWKYVTTTIPSFGVAVTAPDDSRTETYLFNKVASPTSNNFGYTDARNGLPIEQRIYTAGGAMLRRTLYDYVQSSVTINKPVPPNTINTGSYTAHRNARTVKTVNLLLDTGGSALAKTVTDEYAPNGHEFTTGLDQTASTETHFASVAQTIAQTDPIANIPAGLTALRGETAYLNNSAYQNRNILSLPTSVVLKATINGSFQIISRSQSFYDETAYPLLTYGDLDQGYVDPGSTARGNATTVRSYLDVSVALGPGPCPAGVCVQAHAQFDQCGNLVNSSDVRGIQSETEYSGEWKHAYPNKTITAVPDPSGDHGSTEAFTATSTFDFTTGLPLTSTNANGQVTSFSYEDDSGNDDVLNRLRKITRPDGGTTKYSFGDEVGDLFTLVETKQNSTLTLKSYQYVDPLGRGSRSFVSEGGDTYLVTDTIYDQMGRISKVSNPYRTSTRNGIADLAHTTDWLASRYDTLGRVDLLTLPDGSTIQTLYQGIYTTVTDQAGKQRRQKTDGLSRVIRIDEPDANNSLGSIDAPSQPSFYQYNAHGSVVAISQGLTEQGLDPEDPNSYLQHRYFKYDALNRLTHERQVEQVATFTTSADPWTGNALWSRKLVYDETLDTTAYTGLLTSTYDARNIRTQFRYDNLNRIYEVAYSDGTPTINNNYDQPNAGHFNKGQLTKASTGSSGSIPATALVYNFDLMGRVANHQQVVGTQTYLMSYSYDLAGALTSQVYPSGRVVNYKVDASGRPSEVANGSKIYANQFDFTSPTGMLKSITLGNGARESYAYNSRMQTKSVDLTKNGTQIQHYDYKYGLYDPATNTLDETKNTGQIAQIESFVSAQKQWQQRFAYDNLDRLTSAREFRGDNNQRSYLVNYEFDVFGNRYQKQTQNSDNPFPQVWVEPGQIVQATNRFSSGMTYDDAGNVTDDQKFRHRKFQYDANNRQKQSSNSDGSGAVVSVFDAGGKRVGTQVNGSLMNTMVYDAGGRLVAEYNTATANNGTQYVFSDHQGTPRIITNSQGEPVSRHDYLPFGEEIGNVGMRALLPGSGGIDTVRRKYAGMESDEATGMAHTLWRKYDSYSARWTSPDPYGGSITVADPQSFNRYSYVNNDPVNKIDPSGLMGKLPDAGTSWNDVADGFWGSGVAFNQPHFVGPEIIGQRLMERDKAIRDRLDELKLQKKKAPRMRIHPKARASHHAHGKAFMSKSSDGDDDVEPPDEPLDVERFESYAFGSPDEYVAYFEKELSTGDAFNLLGFGADAGKYYYVNSSETMWRGVNGKWYRMGWGGNQYTGGRSLAVAKSGAFNALSKTTFVLGAGISGYEGVQNLREGNKAGATKNGIDIAFGAAGTFGGPIGLTVAGGYFVLDKVIGWENIHESQTKMANDWPKELGPYTPYYGGPIY